MTGLLSEHIARKAETEVFDNSYTQNATPGHTLTFLLGLAFKSIKKMKKDYI